MESAEPWAEAVDGPALADELVKVIKAHVILDNRQSHAVALWIILTYLEDIVDCLPLLAIRSPVKRCGKTILLSLLSRLVNKPLASSNISTAAIYRVIQHFRPTLLMDEVDASLKDNEEARGIINSGHTRDSAYVLRCNAETNEPEKFSTWGPKVLAGIGKLADTLADRSITVRLERRRPTQEITKLRDAEPNTFSALRQKLVRWTLDNREEVQESRPEMPKMLNDRESDNWFPLFAIAGQLGGRWPNEVLKTALALSGSADEDTINTLLLGKILEVINATEESFVPTADLIKELNDDASMPWADWNSGKGLTEHKLAKLLKDFDVSADRRWDGTKKVRGYHSKDLIPIIDRYLPKRDIEPATPPENEA